ncbi:uncharacterized protein PG986_004578 [Apiospora aurea]|uniref:Zn(2)-C6 fungal-type domain-containing protein n=1 Tax=Apiospora aurea TaxID=335848 RepID=A0ABR1QPK6_9PEZI
MASRYLEGISESQYGPPRKELPKRDGDGYRWREPKEKTLPFCSAEREPTHGPMVGYSSDGAYTAEVTNLILDSDDYATAFARGDDTYLEIVFSRADRRMDRAFRAPETLKKPGVVNSRPDAWRPRHPRGGARIHAVRNDNPGPRLMPDLRARLEMAVKTMNMAFEECAEYPLFGRDQGWLYQKKYVDLWAAEWSFTENAKPAELMDLLVHQPGHGNIDVSHAAPSSGTNGILQSTPLASTSSPLFPLRAATPSTPTVATPVATTAAAPVAPTATTAVRPPAPPSRRTALPTIPEAGRMSMPATGVFRSPAALGQHRGGPQADEGASTTTGNSTNSQSRSRSRSRSSSRQSRARPAAQGPTLKTIREKKKADRLLNDDVGQDAPIPCKYCKKTGKKCRVAIDPTTYKSLLCNQCIQRKLGLRDCFTWQNPGFPYDQHMVTVMKDQQLSRTRGKTGGGDELAAILRDEGPGTAPRL